MNIHCESGCFVEQEHTTHAQNHPVVIVHLTKTYPVAVARFALHIRDFIQSDENVSYGFLISPGCRIENKPACIFDNSVDSVIMTNAVEMLNAI